MTWHGERKRHAKAARKGFYSKRAKRWITREEFVAVPKSWIGYGKPISQQLREGDIAANRALERKRAREMIALPR